MNLVDQKPKQSEIHSSTFPQDSDSDSESEIELRSTHTSPETTTSDESGGTLVDTSTSSTPTQSLSGGGDLDSTEGHSQLLVGTLPLTDTDPPKSLEDKGPPTNPSVEGLASGFSENNTGDLSRDKKLATIPPSEKLKQVVEAPSEYLHKINQKSLLILRKAWRYLHLRNHKKSPQMTHFLYFGQEE